MIIVRLMGGLGNQMQQYALYRKFETLGKEARLDTSWFSEKIQKTMQAPRMLELDRFENLALKKASKEEVRALLGRQYEDKEGVMEKIRRKMNPAGAVVFEETEMYHPEVFEWDSKYLVGYWACEAYYADILGKLRCEIRFPQSADPHNMEVAEEMERTVSVSVHIRRGDYLDAANIQMFGNICTESYYESAIRYIRENYENPVFYIFSDDTDYVRSKYQGREYRIVDWNKGDNSLYDMMLMSHCRHNICANSTFSFWGARLNGHADKIMIRPSIHKNTQVCVPEQMQKLWEGYTLITPKGEVILPDQAKRKADTFDILPEKWYAK